MLKRFFMMTVLGLCVLSSSGCIFLAAGAAGVGTAKWLSDKVSQEIDVPRDKVVNSVKDVFKNLQITVTKETETPEVTQILGKYNDGRQVWVDVRPLGPSNTKVEVRVGWMNGESDARNILEQIVKKSNRLF